MSKVQINNVVVLNNPATYQSPFQFEITFDCMENLEDDLEWKLTYVGSAESSNHDQVLDTIYVGPVPEGRHMFVFQADAPDHSKIPSKVRDTIPRLVQSASEGHLGSDCRDDHLLLPPARVCQSWILCPQRLRG